MSSKPEKTSEPERPAETERPSEPPKKSNTALIVIIIAAVVAIPLLCVGGVVGVGVLFWISVSTEPVQYPKPSNVERPPAIDTIPTSDDKRQAFIEYIDGEEIKLPPSDTAHTVRKDEIGVVPFRPFFNSSTVDEVTFVLNTTEGKYAVVGTLSYRRVEEKIVFFGFHLTQIAEQ